MLQLALQQGQDLNKTNSLKYLDVNFGVNKTNSILVLFQILLSIIFLTSFICLISKSSHAKSTTEKLFKRNADNIVYIENKLGGMGTGVLLSSNIILTNRHVVFGLNEDKNEWNAPNKFVLKNGKSITGFNKLTCSVRVDVCFILLNEAVPNKYFASLEPRLISPGEEVVIIGHPSGLQVPIVSTGIASSEISKIPTLNSFRKEAIFLGFTTSAPISMGSSGSPVFSKDGKIIGIIVGMLNDSQNLNFVISSAEIASALLSLTKEDDNSETFTFGFGFEKLLKKEMNNIQKEKELSKNVSAALASNKTKINSKSISSPDPSLIACSSLTVEKDALDCAKRCAIFKNNQCYSETSLGGIDPNSIRKILLTNVPHFKQCYQSSLDKADKPFSGTVKMNFVIGPSGNVVRADIDTSEGMSLNILGCLVNTLKGLQFPEPLGGGLVEVNQPFNFYPKQI